MVLLLVLGLTLVPTSANSSGVQDGNLCSQAWDPGPCSGESRIDFSLRELCLELGEGLTRGACVPQTHCKANSYKQPATSGDKILQRPTIDIPKIWKEKLGRQFLWGIRAIKTDLIYWGF